jgi:hypothetical protein
MYLTVIGPSELISVFGSVGDPEPDPHVFGPSEFGSISQGYRSGFLKKALNGLKYCLQNQILTQNFSKKKLRLKIMCLRVSYKKKNE